MKLDLISVFESYSDGSLCTELGLLYMLDVIFLYTKFDWKLTPCEDRELILYTEVWLTTFESWKTALGPPSLVGQVFLLRAAVTWGMRKMKHRDLHPPETSSA